MLNIPKQIYKPEDFLNAVEETPLKTQIIKERLGENNPVYSKIHVDWVKQTLKKLFDNGLVCGGLDPNFGGYVWHIPAELRYNPEDFIQVLAKRPINTASVLERVNKPVKMHRKYKALTEALAVDLLKTLAEGGQIVGEQDKETKEWKWCLAQE